ncbi:MAG: hypothetical protein NZ704_15220, partial [Geminicoccaceae bacterium]|nr:hypothetical protein [Geminicoccaceae bacterium]
MDPRVAPEDDDKGADRIPGSGDDEDDAWILGSQAEDDANAPGAKGAEAASRASSWPAAEPAIQGLDPRVEPEDDDEGEAWILGSEAEDDD